MSHTNKIKFCILFSKSFFIETYFEFVKTVTKFCLFRKLLAWPIHCRHPHFIVINVLPPLNLNNVMLDTVAVATIVFDSSIEMRSSLKKKAIMAATA